VRRFLTLAAVIVTALLLQTTVFADVRLLGARPELMYLLTIVFAMLEGPSSGAITGFAGGMAQDFMLNQPKGITALTLTLLGYAVGLLRQYVVSPSPVRRGRRDVLRGAVLRVGVLPARTVRQHGPVPVPGGRVIGRVQRHPDPARVPGPSTGGRGVALAARGAVVTDP
jgi:hypothetical protein